MVLSYEKDYPDGMCAKDDPNTLLYHDTEPRPDWRKGTLIPLGVGFLGALGPLISNFSKSYPLNTGIYRYPIAFAIGVAVGKIYEDYRNEQLAILDAHYKQYIRNHPEDFQPSERKKVGELLKPWVPIR